MNIMVKLAAFFFTITFIICGVTAYNMWETNKTYELIRKIRANPEAALMECQATNCLNK